MRGARLDRFVRTGSVGTYRCGQCNAAAVAARRREIKSRLVAEAGGGCAVCGFDTYLGACSSITAIPLRKRSR